MTVDRLRKEYQNARIQEQIENLKEAIAKWNAARAHLIASRSTDEARYSNLLQFHNAAIEEIANLKSQLQKLD